ncbi:hypothetical protein V9L00_02420 [Pseudoxanthomonas sp. CCNWLW206]
MSNQADIGTLALARAVARAALFDEPHAFSLATGPGPISPFPRNIPSRNPTAEHISLELQKEDWNSGKRMYQALQVDIYETSPYVSGQLYVFFRREEAEIELTRIAVVARPDTTLSTIVGVAADIAVL